MSVRSDTNLLPLPVLCSEIQTLALSQVFDSTQPSQVVRSADDFIIPEGETWALNQVSVEGRFLGSDPGNVNGVNLIIYADANGSPGVQICRFEGLKPQSGTDDPNFIVDLSGNANCPVFGAGVYWLSLIYAADVAVDLASRRWYWSQSIVNLAAVDDAQWHIRIGDDLDELLGDPVDASCQGWASADDCFASQNPLRNLCFGLGGDTPVRLTEPLLDQFASEGSRFLMATAENFSDPDGDTLSYSAIGLPESLAINPLNGRITGEVEVGAAAGSPYRVTVSVIDQDGDTAQDSFLLLIADNEISEFQFERLWPVLQQSWYFGNAAAPIGVAAGRLYVANQQFSQIQQFTFDGFLVSSHQIEGPIPGSIGKPTTVAGDENGFIYAIGQADPRVHKLDSSGNQLLQFGALGSPFTSQPLFLAVTNRGCGQHRGCVLVAEADRVHRFASDGEYLSTFAHCTLAIPSCSNGTVRRIGGLSATDSGLVYITDSVENEVVVLRHNANSGLASPPVLVGEFGSAVLDTPGDIDVAESGKIFVVDATGVVAFNRTGDFLDAFPAQLALDGSAETPVFLELLEDGSGFISNAYAQISRVRLFGDLTTPGDASLVLALPFASSGDQEGFFRDPADLAASPSGAIYVTDPLNHRIQKFDPEGNFQLAWGQQGSLP